MKFSKTLKKLPSKKIISSFVCVALFGSYLTSCAPNYTSGRKNINVTFDGNGGTLVSGEANQLIRCVATFLMAGIFLLKPFQNPLVFKHNGNLKHIKLPII